jgi:hypothetical protein
MEVDENVNVDRFSEECPSETETLELAPLPCWVALTVPERSCLVAKLVADIDAAAPNATTTTEDTSHITAQNPLGSPIKTSHTRRPKAHASTKRLWIEAVRRYRDFLSAFRQASSEWLSGVFEVEFPPHSFRPPPWSVPARIV